MIKLAEARDLLDQAAPGVVLGVKRSWLAQAVKEIEAGRAAQAKLAALSLQVEAQAAA